MTDPKNLKSLEDHNFEVQRARWGSPAPNGIACPLCGNELWDSSPSIMLTSYPPQYNVHCPSCNYHGYRY